MYKKLLLFLCGLFIGLDAHALTMCARTGTYVGVVKKSINGKSSSYDATDKTWSVTYDYSTVDGNSDRVLMGIAACNEVAGTVNTAKTNLVTTVADVGTHCWCKMEPVPAYNVYTGLTSYWVLLRDDYTTESDCASDCAADCASAMLSNTGGFRSALFESIK